MHRQRRTVVSRIMRPDRAALSLLPVLLWACVPASTPAPIPRHRTSDTHSLKSGAVLEGLVIVSADSGPAFELKGAFTPPFESSLYDPTDSGSREASNEWEWALSRGARRVRLHANGQDYFGVLALNRIPTSSTSASSANYRISVPQSTFVQARGGKIAWIGEFVPYKYRGNITVTRIVLFLTLPTSLPLWFVPNIRNAIRRANGPTWVLWISDTPF